MFLLPLPPHESLILASVLHCHEGEVGCHLVLVHVNTTNDIDSVNSAVYATALAGSYVKEHNRVVLGGKEGRREGGIEGGGGKREREKREGRPEEGRK